MELTKTSLYSPDDLIELLKTSGAPLSKIAEETAIPEPTLKNYKYGKTLIDSMPYRIVVELSRFFRQYDLNVEKLKSYGHVILPEKVDNDHYKYVYGVQFEDNPHLYALRVLHLFTSREDMYTHCELFKLEYSFDHVFVVMTQEIIDLIAKIGWLSMKLNMIFEKMSFLNITCIWPNSMFKKLYRYFDDLPDSYDFIELLDQSINTERLMIEMKQQLFTNDYELDELEYVDDVLSNVAVQYVLTLFGIDPNEYHVYRWRLGEASRDQVGYLGVSLFAEKRVKREYKNISFNNDALNEIRGISVKPFKLQMELYKVFDLEISKKYNLDEILRKGTYEKLFE